MVVAVIHDVLGCVVVNVPHEHLGVPPVTVLECSLLTHPDVRRRKIDGLESILL